MIIKIHKPGRSFKGVCRYLTHDVKAGTADRVAWTHTLNLANDDVPSAIDEMLWTFRSADLLKREARISTGGSRMEKPVKHFSLSWAHGETPSKEHVIETVRAYMQHMGWADRQAVLVAHNDTRHAHAHVVMNSISPTDGRAVRSSHDWRRSEAFALRYEREHGQVLCEQRLKPKEDRQATPTRESWQRFKKSEAAFERSEVERLTKRPDYFERHNDKLMNSREWEALKAHQKQEREHFFMDGKQAFRNARNAVFREVREEFRDQWKTYYAAARGGFNKATLAEMKLALTTAQNKALDERRQAAGDQLRKDRDRAYDTILAQQKFDRAELTVRQHQGLRTYPLMDVIYPAPQQEMPTHDAKGPWQARETAEPAAKEHAFARAGQAAIDPFRDGDQHQPGVLRRKNETPVPAPSLESTDQARQRDQQAQDRKRQEDMPRRDVSIRTEEITDAASERMRAERVREMTDQARTKARDGDAAILRASWNRSRRSRGGRD